MLFDLYKQEARKRTGIRNSIILVKKSPEIVAKDTNPVNALTIISSLRPTDSQSNIWDAMMAAGEIASEKATIIVRK